VVEADCDNRSSSAGNTSSVRWSRNWGIVWNLFLHAGHPSTMTPRPPCAIDGGSLTNVEKSCRWSSVRSAWYNSDFFMVSLGWERERDDRISDSRQRCRRRVERSSFYRCSCGNISRMKIRDLTKKQLSSVPCPMCGVPAGHRCLLQAGGLRKEPHTDRKLVATDMVERKRTRLKRDSSRVSATT
jgi:hypothetical protein